MKRHAALIVFLLLVVSLHVVGTTWFPKEFTCPISGTKNTFQVVGSYGTYIYSWPSKFQLIFWPRTDANVLYSCKQCHFTAFMWDFEKPPEEKIEEIRAVLAETTLPAEESYAHVPMTDRLQVAEKMYTVLERDDEWWCNFYRVVGYHAELEGKDEQAAVARRKALELAHKMLSQPETQGRRKELLLVAAAMHHFLQEEEQALTLLREAAASKMQDPRLNAEQNENAEKYLSALIQEYTDRLEKGEPIPGSRPTQ